MDRTNALGCNIDMFSKNCILYTMVIKDKEMTYTPISARVSIENLPAVINSLANTYKVNDIKLFGAVVDYCDGIKAKILDYAASNYSNNNLRIEVIDR